MRIEPDPTDVADASDAIDDDLCKYELRPSTSRDCVSKAVATHLQSGELEPPRTPSLDSLVREGGGQGSGSPLNTAVEQVQGASLMDRRLTGPCLPQLLLENRSTGRRNVHQT